MVDKIIKNDEIYHYGEFILLKDMLVGEFCNAFSDLKIYASKNSGSKADEVLNRVIEYGLGAYRDYDEYCASSNISCQVINQQVTKLKRIRDEIKY